MITRRYLLKYYPIKKFVITFKITLWKHKIIFFSFIFGIFICVKSWAQQSKCIRSQPLRIEQLTNELNCRPLDIGGKTVVSDQSSASLTKISRDYILKRVNETTYKIILNIKFNEYSLLRQIKHLVDKTETSKEKQMRQKVNSCLSLMNPYLKGPNNQRIEIELANINTQDVDEQKIRNEILISEENDFQVHSKAFKLDMDCPVILHELLHHLGLVDEYAEIRSESVLNRANIDKSDCRITGVSSSIMNEASLMPLEQFMKRTKLSVVTGEVCSCVELNRCPQKMPDKECKTPGYKKEFRKIVVPESANMSVIESSIVYNSTYGVGQSTPLKNSTLLNLKVVRYDQVPKDSILLPAQFRMIVQPKCQTLNSRYAKCASRSRIGTRNILPGINFSSCDPAPDFCQNGEWLQ